ncbi:hypothetical protein [Adhaeribacter radiodurans]|uniref:ArnR1-like winged helix-turn-helix domain-containing protein n=1 Tax=Adhaeribacter radiodurans TaxID=2745197 RepID=A0A7L7L6C5_9BACT|nr:hypothetical protein [Adhaeribacter radiodurans]QMU28367.1 hypothetical protein HUW48_10120 [Adhaeribacter radiodurans]
MIEAKEIPLLEDVKKEILEFCLQAKSRTDILEYISVGCTSFNYSRYIGALLTQRFIKSNLLDKRHSRQGKFVITQKGLNYLKAIAY